MALPKTSEAKRFYRAANERLDDGRFLLDKDRTTGAVYLAGYAVECMLKALILANIKGEGLRKEMVTSFRGSKAHDFDWLKAVYRDSGGAPLPPEVARAFSRINSWSTDLRYHPGAVKAREATGMFSAAEQIFEWADGRL